MRLNRRVPNGTHGGVRGRGLFSPSYSIVQYNTPISTLVTQSISGNARCEITMRLCAVGAITILGDSNPMPARGTTIHYGLGGRRLICTPGGLPAISHYFSSSFVFQLVSCNVLSSSRSSRAMPSAVFCRSAPRSSAFTLISVPRARLVFCPAVYTSSR